MAHSHQLLYENIEVNLTSEEGIRIDITIHAPELPLAVARKVDPAAVGEEWLKSLSDDDLAELVRQAETFVRSHFVLSYGQVDLVESGARWEFSEPALLRDPPPESALPAGCFLGTLWMKWGESGTPLVVGFDAEAQKRLLVAVARPASFPEVHDLAPGESVSLVLAHPAPKASEADSPPTPDTLASAPGIQTGVGRRVMIFLATVLGLGGLGALLARRRTSA